MRRTSWPGVVLAAAAAAALVAAAGALIEPLRLGASREASFELVRQQVGRRFEQLTRTLRRTAVSLANSPGLPDALDDPGVPGGSRGIAPRWPICSS